MQLTAQGFTHLTLAVNHLSQLIEAYIGDGSRWNIRIDYSREDRELSTIGPLTLIDDLPENFLVMNGDILCDLDYRAFLGRHEREKCEITVSSYSRAVAVDFGVLEYDKKGELTLFKEKPELRFDVSMGIYCIDREIIRSLPRGKPYGFDRLMIDSLAAGRPVAVRPFKGFWLDIGRPDDYEAANRDFPALMKKLGVPE